MKVYDSKQIGLHVLRKHKSQPLKEIELEEIKPEILPLDQPKEQRLDSFATIYDDGGVTERDEPIRTPLSPKRNHKF